MISTGKHSFRRTHLFCLPMAMVILVILGFSEEGWFTVLLPFFTILMILVYTLFNLWDRDGEIPAFDVGALCILATSMYFLVPSIGYMAGGLSFSILSSPRLFILYPSPAEMATVLWDAVVYMFCLSGTYLFFRIKRSTYRQKQPVLPDIMTMQIIVLLFIAISTILHVYPYLTGWNDSRLVSYEDLMLSMNQTIPTHWRLAIENLWRYQIVYKFFFFVFLLVSAKVKKRYLYLGILMLLVEIIYTFQIQGRRTELVFIFIVFMMAYHRVVKPFPFLRLMAIGGVFLVIFLVHGALRSKDDYRIKQTNESVLTNNNEFQDTFATMYDVYYMKRSNLLPPIPLDVRLTELFAFIPSQISFFDESDYSLWYLRVIGIEGTGRGMQFGILSCGYAGYGIIELIIRGILLGFLLAGLFNLYNRHADNVYFLVFYLYVAASIYLSARAYTLHDLPLYILGFIPAYLVVKISRAMLTSYLYILEKGKQKLLERKLQAV